MIKFNRLSHGAIVPMWIVTTQLHSTNLFQVRNLRARLVALWLIGFPTAVTGAFRYVVFPPVIHDREPSIIWDFYSRFIFYGYLYELIERFAR